MRVGASTGDSTDATCGSSLERREGVAHVLVEGRIVDGERASTRTARRRSGRRACRAPSATSSAPSVDSRPLDRPRREGSAARERQRREGEEHDAEDEQRDALAKDEATPSREHCATIPRNARRRRRSGSTLAALRMTSRNPAPSSPRRRPCGARGARVAARQRHPGRAARPRRDPRRRAGPARAAAVELGRRSDGIASRSSARRARWPRCRSPSGASSPWRPSASRPSARGSCIGERRGEARAPRADRRFSRPAEGARADARRAAPRASPTWPRWAIADPRAPPLRLRRRARGEARRDRAAVFAVAPEAVRGGRAHESWESPCSCSTCRSTSERERDFVPALVARAQDVLVTVPAGDERTLARVRRSRSQPEELPAEGPPKDCRRRSSPSATRRRSPRSPTGARHHLGARREPRMRRDCTRHPAEAEAGVPLRSHGDPPARAEPYRAHLEEALRRASIPAHFARGTARPDPAGRALLALARVQARGRSRRRASPSTCRSARSRAPTRRAHRRAALARGALGPARRGGRRRRPARALEDDGERRRRPRDRRRRGRRSWRGTLRAPRLWERLLVDAAVIEDSGRWARRLDGLEDELRADVEHAKAQRRGRRRGHFERDLDALGAPARLRAAAPRRARGAPRRARSWGEWIERSRVAREPRARATRRACSAALAELDADGRGRPVRSARGAPRARAAARRRARCRRAGRATARSSSRRPTRRAAWSSTWSSCPASRRRCSRRRSSKTRSCPTRAREGDRAAHERRALRADERLALASRWARRAVASSRRYPRLDVEQARPRTPSFYALELAARGRGRAPRVRRSRAARATRERRASAGPRRSTRPGRHRRRRVRSRDPRARAAAPAQETVGAARYLLTPNPHLGRALRFRAERWHKQHWYRSDGLVNPSAEAHEALAHTRLGARSFSPTALQNFASCPYQFPPPGRAPPRAARGARAARGHRPAPARLDDARGAVRDARRAARREALARHDVAPRRRRAPCSIARPRSVAARYEDELTPAIPRVWEDGVARIRADLAEWLRRMATDETTAAGCPRIFELSFGLAKAPAAGPAQRGKAARSRLRNQASRIDRPRRARGATAALRATDHKSGKVRADESTVIGGGKTLQPVLYALAIEKLLGGTVVDGGRLYYCTSVGDYTSVDIPLDDEARAAAKLVADTLPRRDRPRASCRRRPRRTSAGGATTSASAARTKRRASRRSPRTLVPLSRLRERA